MPFFYGKTKVILPFFQELYLQGFGLAAPDLQEALEICGGDDHGGGVVAGVEADGGGFQKVGVVEELDAVPVVEEFLRVGIRQVHVVDKAEE